MQRYTKYPKRQTFFKYFTMISVKTQLYLTDKANKFTKLLQKGSKFPICQSYKADKPGVMMTKP